MFKKYKEKFIGDREFYANLIRLIIPMIVQQGITSFVSLLDNVMVGRLGTESMSGVAIVNQLLFVFNLTIFGGLAGASIFGAQFYGKGDHKGVRYALRFKLIFSVLMAVIAIVLAILAPLIARLLYFACSRQREYLADASAAQFTRYPAGLAHALQKIAAQQEPKKIQTNRVVAPMYVINPLAAAGSASIFGTHPPTADRIQRLLAMQGEAPA